jgi:D-sedoheptulose 7-phosphate isomerase
MAYFPSKIYQDAGEYLDAYASQITRALGSLDRDQLSLAARCLEAAIVEGRTIFSCGNGGSCAIANHLVCDYLKGIQSGTDLKPRVVSLSSNLEVITAVANDISYDDVFSLQLRSLGRPDDVLIAVSSSGNSPNILRALAWARDNGLRTIAMTGFDGGRAKETAEIPLHVEADNYGVIEDVHQSLMHLLAQYLRQNHLCDTSLIGQSKF